MMRSDVSVICKVMSPTALVICLSVGRVLEMPPARKRRKFDLEYLACAVDSLRQYQLQRLQTATIST